MKKAKTNTRTSRRGSTSSGKTTTSRRRFINRGIEEQRLSMVEGKVSCLMRSLVEGDLVGSNLLETLSRGQAANANEIAEHKVLLYGITRMQDQIEEKVGFISRSTDSLLEILENINLKLKKYDHKKRRSVKR